MTGGPAGVPDPGVPDPGVADPGNPVQAIQGRNPWKTAFFLMMAGAVVAALLWVVYASPLLAVRSVQVTGTGDVPRPEVLAAADIPLGVPLIRVNTAAAAARIGRIAQLRSVRVTRDWPDRVVISVQQRIPVLAVPVSGGFALVDAAGVMVRQVPRPPAGIPVMTVPGLLRGNPGIRAAAQVLRDLPPNLRRQITAASIATGQAVTLHLADGITVGWGTSADSASKARELEILLRTHARYYDVSGPGTAVTG